MTMIRRIGKEFVDAFAWNARLFCDAFVWNIEQARKPGPIRTTYIVVIVAAVVAAIIVA